MVYLPTPLALRSPSDKLQTLQEKMQEYIANGAQLGWLIDPQRQIVEISRPDANVERLENPQMISGEDILPGFELDLTEILS